MALSPRKDYVTQATCDMTNPEEHLLWALMAIQMGDSMMPILENTARTMSKHLHELGFRHHPDLQQKKYQPPLRGQQNHMNGLARWVPVDAEEPEPIVLPNVGEWTQEEAEWVKAEMKRHGLMHEEPPKVQNPAQIADWHHANERAIKRTTTTQELGIEGA